MRALIELGITPDSELLVKFTILSTRKSKTVTSSEGKCREKRRTSSYQHVRDVVDGSSTANDPVEVATTGVC